MSDCAQHEAELQAAMERVRVLEAALDADIKAVKEALFVAIDRLAQAQQVVVSSLENAAAIIKTAGAK